MMCQIPPDKCRKSAGTHKSSRCTKVLTIPFSGGRAIASLQNVKSWNALHGYKRNLCSHFYAKARLKTTTLAYKITVFQCSSCVKAWRTLETAQAQVCTVSSVIIRIALYTIAKREVKNYGKERKADRNGKVGHGNC